MTNSPTPQDDLYPNTSTSSDINLAQNEAYNSRTSSNDTCVPISTNKAYLEISNNGHTPNTDISTSTNQTYLEDGPVYEDADIPTSTNQSYPKMSCQSDSATVTYDYIPTWGLGGDLCICTFTQLSLLCMMADMHIIIP